MAPSRSVLSLFFVAVLALFAGISQAFDEGIEYKKLELAETKGEGGKILVQEFFWYGCPHCYSMEPYLAEWKKKMPSNVEFEAVPAPFNPVWALHARGFYAAQQLGVAEKAHVPLFKAIHDNKQRIFDRQSLADFYATQGADRDKFLKLLSSFSVDGKVRRADSLTRRYQLDSVPSFAVNGVYVTSPSMAGTNERALQVLDQLIAQLGGTASAQ